MFNLLRIPPQQRIPPRMPSRIPPHLLVVLLVAVCSNAADQVCQWGQCSNDHKCGQTYEQVSPATNGGALCGTKNHVETWSAVGDWRPCVDKSQCPGCNQNCPTDCPFPMMLQSDPNSCCPFKCVGCDQQICAPCNGLWADDGSCCGKCFAPGQPIIFNSCAVGCGGQSDGTCWCDDLCEHYGDCCVDYKFHCGTCAGSCGGKAKGVDCWCDNLCVGYGDCCDDYQNVCGATRRQLATESPRRLEEEPTRGGARQLEEQITRGGARQLEEKPTRGNARQLKAKPVRGGARKLLQMQ